MRVLVTGGCGYIGSFTARALQAAGHQVLVVDDLSEGHRPAWAGELVQLDLLDAPALDEALRGRGIQGAVHFAARAYVDESVRQPLRYWRQNLVPLLNVAEALPGVPIVFSSTCAVYGEPRSERLAEDHPREPVNPYGATKAAGERLLCDRAAGGGGGFAALRYFNAAGAAEDGAHGEDHRPESHLLPLAIAAAEGRRAELVVHGSDWPTEDGTCVRDFVHVEDLAAAHRLALEHLAGGGPSGAWNLGTGSGSSVREVLRAVADAVGRPVPFRDGPRRPGDPARLVADASRAARELGWRPVCSDLASLVQTALRWHRAHPSGYGPAAP
ncbi:MAG TPA: UDP-glucose 4-epimerase GalE [Planctomycetota bacterium]